MKKLVGAVLSSLLIGAMAAPAFVQTPAAQAAKVQPPKGFDMLGWLAGTRYIERDGVKSHETWTGVSGGLISGSVASAVNGGLAEFFMVGPNEQGVYGLKTANTARGLTNWTFRPIKSIEPGKIVFADATGSFSIEATPDGGIHNIAMRVADGKKTKSGEWFWLPMSK